MEVLNLGVRAYGSEDVLDLLRRFVPELEPDLVVYGVCLNDFLERGARQQASPAFLPEKLTKILTRRTRVGGSRWSTSGPPPSSAPWAWSPTSTPTCSPTSRPAIGASVRTLRP